MKDSLRKDAETGAKPSKITVEKRVFHSQQLFNNEREIVIVHGDAQYRLQITKAGKLILNK